MGRLLLTALTVIVMGMVAMTIACPSACTCNLPSNVITCKSVSSVATIVTEIPPATQQIHIEGGTLQTLKETDFSTLQATQLLELSITGTQLSEIQDSAFKTLLSLQKLRLSRNQIYSLTENAYYGLSHLHELDLSHNKIRSLYSQVLNPLISLRRLDLSYNLINDIPAGLFTAQRNLQILTLQGNHVGNLRGESFQGLTNLRTLFAGGCDIRNIDSSVFNMLSGVDTLDLSYNDLIVFPSHTDLQTLRVLRNLTLQGNRLTGLNNYQFQGLHLDTLDLSRNSITKIEPNVFSGVGSIRYLYLSYNNLNFLPDFVFQPMAEQIINLQLNNNKGLTQLPSNLFNGMHTLTDLNLSSCSLQYLDDQQFYQLHNLHTVDIAGNFLKNLPKSFVEKTNFMRHVKLAGNPWHCDCLIKPLRDWLQSPRSASLIYCSGAFEGFSNNCRAITCATPQNLMGKDIKDLQDSELETCERIGESNASPVNIIIAVVVVIVVVGIIGLVLVCLFYRRHKRGEPLLCGEDDKENKRSNKDKRSSRDKRSKEPKEDFYREKKDRRSMDPDIGSLNESDKSYVVRNYFSSMLPDPEVVSRGTPSMTRKESFDSVSGITGHESNHSSQYSLNAGYRIESAV